MVNNLANKQDNSLSKRLIRNLLLFGALFSSTISCTRQNTKPNLEDKVKQSPELKRERLSYRFGELDGLFGRVDNDGSITIDQEEHRKEASKFFYIINELHKEEGCLDNICLFKDFYQKHKDDKELFFYEANSKSEDASILLYFLYFKGISSLYENQTDDKEKFINLVSKDLTELTLMHEEEHKLRPLDSSKIENGDYSEAAETELECELKVLMSNKPSKGWVYLRFLEGLIAKCSGLEQLNIDSAVMFFERLNEIINGKGIPYHEIRFSLHKFEPPEGIKIKEYNFIIPDLGELEKTVAYIVEKMTK